MSDHLPKFAPGRAVTREASATVVGGQLLTVTGDGTVGPSTAGAVFAGVASNDAADGELLLVQRGGVHVLTAAEAITAGALVQCGAAGKVALWENGTDAAEDVIGFAWEAVDADATGEFQIHP
jgi:hypothetical protein